MESAASKSPKTDHISCSQRLIIQPRRTQTRNIVEHLVSLRLQHLQLIRHHPFPKPAESDIPHRVDHSRLMIHTMGRKFMLVWEPQRRWTAAERVFPNQIKKNRGDPHSA